MTVRTVPVKQGATCDRDRPGRGWVGPNLADGGTVGRVCGDRAVDRPVSTALITRPSLVHMHRRGPRHALRSPDGRVDIINSTNHRTAATKSENSTAVGGRMRR